MNPELKRRCEEVGRRERANEPIFYTLRYLESALSDDEVRDGTLGPLNTISEVTRYFLQMPSDLVAMLLGAAIVRERQR